MVAEKKGEKIQFRTTGRIVKSEKRTVRSERWEVSSMCKVWSVPGQGVAPFLAAAWQDQELDPFLALLDGHSVDPAEEREKSKKWVNLQIFLYYIFSVPDQDRREKKHVARWKVSALHVCSDRCAAATSSPRKRGSSPGGTHKKPGEAVLIQQARGCRVIKPLFSRAISQQQTLP